MTNLDQNNSCIFQVILKIFSLNLDSDNLSSGLMYYTMLLQFLISSLRFCRRIVKWREKTFISFFQDAYLESSQTSLLEVFYENKNKSFRKKAPWLLCDRILNTPLFSLCWIFRLFNLMYVMWGIPKFWQLNYCQKFPFLNENKSEKLEIM